MAEYLNFDVRIDPHGKNYRVHVASPAGEAKADFNLPVEDYYERYLRERSKESIKIFGEKLFNAVFSGEGLICFIRCRDMAKDQGKALRLRLRLRESPDLLNLAWEYLYDPSGDKFLALSPQISIVHYLELPVPIPALRVCPPLKILAVISSPTDAPQLNAELEWQRIKTALKEPTRSGLVSLELLNHATLESLCQRLRNKDYHVLHYIGHGRWDRQKRCGMLILEDEDHLSRPWSGDDLGEILQDHDSLRLAVLNACEGSRTTSQDPFSGIAQHFVQLGLPAVIAMQFPIIDDTAVTFAENFYDTLADGTTIDEALAHARRAIFARGSDTECATPVLYMRSNDGVLFEIDYSQEPPFTIGIPITQPRHFFGRETELTGIFGLLRKTPLQNAAIVGPTHSGKTSLLHYIMNICTTNPKHLRPGQRTNWLPHPERYRWVFANFHDPRLGTRHGFLRYLLAQMDLPISDACDLDYFITIVSNNLQAPTIILLNGMSYALKHYPGLNKQFWNAMRALVADSKVDGCLAFIVALPNLKDIFDETPDSAMESPFFNIFGYTAHLKPFKEEEVSEFIASLPANFSPEDVKWILQKSMGYPVYLQILCRARWREFQKDPSSNSWKDEGLREMEEIVVPPLPPPPPPPPPQPIVERIFKFVKRVIEILFGK